MSAFNFEFILKNLSETFQIKPPLSYFALKEMAEKRFSSIKIANFYQEEDETQISNESDYFDFINWAESSNLKQIEILVKCGDSKPKKKTSPAMKIKYVTQKFKLPVSNHCDYVQDIDTINGIFIDCAC